MSDKLLHIFSSNSALALASPEGDAQADGEPKLLWKIVLRTGTWKLRPGPGGVKLDQPLKILRDKAPKGHISLSAIKEAFDAGAKEHVTVPTVHADGTTSDSGFVRKLVIQDVPGEDGSKEKHSLLWAGIEITDSAIKTKVEEKSLVGCSGGVLFDYARTEDGKRFDQILSHVMLTNSPWINGCGGFEKKLPEGVMASEEQPSDQDEVFLDADAPPLSEGGVEPPSGVTKEKPAEGTVVWRPEEGFSFMKAKVQRALDAWRRSVLAALPDKSRSYEDFPYMRVQDVSHDGASGKAMITSGYGDDAATWVANFKLDDEKDAVVEPFQNWTEAAQEWVAASEEPGGPQAKPAPSSGRAPYSPPDRGSVELSDLRRAQLAREQRSSSTRNATPTSNNGGRPMSKLSELLSGLELSDVQRRLADEALQEEASREQKALKDAEARRESDAKAYLSEMDGWGLGDNDTPGLRAVVRDIFMSDDGGTALLLSEETKSGRRTSGDAVTATEIAKRVIGALPRNQEGKVTLSEQARVIPGDAKPPVGEAADGGAEQDKTTPQERADALLSEGDGFTFAAPAIGGER